MPVSNHYRMLNGRLYDAVPAALYRARSNDHARRLAQSEWLIRDKRDGGYVASLRRGRLEFFQLSALCMPRVDAIAELLFTDSGAGGYRPTTDLDPLLWELGLNADRYRAETGLQPVAEPMQLEYAGRDRYQRPLWLDYDTGKAWQRMHQAALADGVALHAISGFRSPFYQMAIFRRKLARGVTLEAILEVNAAPGFSEHHSGRAIDIGTRDEPAAEQSFEHTPAFNWLIRHAGRFGFRMSFPRGNPHGIGYEPWHWYWLGSDQS
mgnify:CR=1 FL=1